MQLHDLISHLGSNPDFADKCLKLHLDIFGHFLTMQTESMGVIRGRAGRAIVVSYQRTSQSQSDLFKYLDGIDSD